MNLKQTKWASLREQLLNTGSGFVLSLTLQWLFFDVWLGLPLHPVQNLTFAVIMTVVSIARGYTVRRIFEATGLRAKMSPAMQAVMAERLRQHAVEGYGEEHDNLHADGELAMAGAAYLLTARTGRIKVTSVKIEGDQEYPIYLDPAAIFPWRESWKPVDKRRNLVKGIALGIADLERFDRMRTKRK